MGFFKRKVHIQEKWVPSSQQLLCMIERLKGRRQRILSSEADEHTPTFMPFCLVLTKQKNVRVYKNHAHKESEDDKYNENGDLLFRSGQRTFELKSRDFLYKGDKITLILTFEGSNVVADIDYVTSLFDVHQIKYYKGADLEYRADKTVIMHDVIDIIKAINIIKTLVAKDTPFAIDHLNKQISKLKKSREYRRARLNRIKGCVELIAQAYLQGISKFSKPPIELVKEYVEAELQSTLTEAELQDINLLLDKLVNLHLSLKNSLYLGKICHSDHSLFNRLPPEVLEQVGGFYLQGQNPSSISTGSDLRKNAGTLFELGIRKDKGKEKILLKERATNPDELSDSEDELETCDVQRAFT